MKKNKWTLDNIRVGFDRFYNENKRYPTAREIDSCAYLPSSRQIQRTFEGGLPALRTKLKLDGPTDFTKGEYSSARAKTINERAHKIEKSIYDELVDRFGQPFVHRERFFTDDKRTRADFYIYGKSSNFFVDVFYPKDRDNLMGCLNSKLRTYKFIPKDMPDKVIFLMMNQELSEDDIQGVLATKRSQPLGLNQKVMTYREFKGFIRTVAPRQE